MSLPRSRSLPTAAAAVLAVFPALAAPGVELALSSRAGARIQAVAALSASGAPAGCLTPAARSLGTERFGMTPAARRAIGMLGADATLAGERRVTERDVTVRFTTDRTSPDRVDPTDDNGNGRPDLVDAVLAGAARAHRSLVGGLELPAPPGVEFVLARLGPGIDGVTLVSREGRVPIWLDPSSRSAATLRRAAEHQFAHAVVDALGLDAPWSEAFSTWASSSLEGGPDDPAAAAISQRLARMGEGLGSEDLALAAGNAAWFAFLEETYGRTAVKLAVEELARGGSLDAALDRALRRTAGTTFPEAFREFHLWSVLTGPRTDGRHFPFAARLAPPTFAGVAELLPALSIQADPEVASLGSASVLLAPVERAGGLALRFEGDRLARWEVDVLLVRSDGTMHRLPVPLDDLDAGELTVPLQELREAVILIRNLDPDGRAPKRYSWSAHHEPGYPAEIAGLEAEASGSPAGRIVSWQTLGERGVLGFNVLRTRSGSTEEVRVNPVWIPAIGDAGVAAAYSFLDTGARPGVAYQYRIEAVTPEGLVSRSEPVLASSR